MLWSILVLLEGYPAHYGAVEPVLNIRLRRLVSAAVLARLGKMVCDQQSPMCPSVPIWRRECWGLWSVVADVAPSTADYSYNRNLCR